MAKLTPNRAAMRPLFRWLLWILGGLLILLIVLQIIISLYADDYVAAQLKQKVRTGSDSTYTLSFDDLSLNIFGGSISIDNLQIHADTAAFSPPVTSGHQPAGMLFRGTISQLKVSGINVYAALLGDALSVGTVSIDQPDIAILKNPHPVKKDTSAHAFSSVDSSIYAAISNRYHSLEVDELAINKGHVLFSSTGGDTLSAVDRLNLTLRDIRVDSASARSGRQFVTDNISFAAHSLLMNLPDKLNSIRLGQLAISSQNHSIQLDSLHLIPRYPRFKFSQKKGVEIDRIDLQVPAIQFKNVDFAQWVDSSRFHASNVAINHAVMKDFRDKNRPFPPHNRPPLPHVALKNMAAKLKIDTLQVQNSYISYSEYWYRTPRAGTISFEQLDATIYNLNNYANAIENGQVIKMDARARVMGKGLLKAHFEFPMNTKSGFHKVSGSLSAMPLTSFNPMLKYVAFVRIDEGKLNSLKFDMTLNNTRSSGTVIMNYENLKISVLDKKSLKQKGIMQHLKTFAANIIIKKNNTPENGMQAGRISFERIQRKSVFNYWWKSLLSGIKTSVK